MPLESGKSQGNGKVIRTALAGVGLGLVSLVGWNALDSEQDRGQIVKPNEDSDSEAKKYPEAEKNVAMGMEGVKTDVLEVLNLPSNLPTLKGVKEETLQEKSKRFLAEVDKWLHVPAQAFDLKHDADISDKQREFFMNYKADFKIAAEETRKVMKDDLLFWEAKQKIDAAFPNYELMGEQSEGTNVYDGSASTHTFFYIMERPKLTDSDGKTMTGFKPPSSDLVEWKLYNENGVMYLQSPEGSGELFSGSIEECIAKIESFSKRKSLMDKYRDPELVKEYQKQGLY